MSSAFTKDMDDGGALPEPGERPVSTHRNLVTPNGMTMIETEIAVLREEHSKAEAAGDREKLALGRPRPALLDRAARNGGNLHSRRGQ